MLPIDQDLQWEDFFNPPILPTFLYFCILHFCILYFLQNLQLKEG